MKTYSPLISGAKSTNCYWKKNVQMQLIIEKVMTKLEGTMVAITIELFKHSLPDSSLMIMEMNWWHWQTNSHLIVNLMGMWSESMNQWPTLRTINQKNQQFGKHHQHEILLNETLNLNTSKQLWYSSKKKDCDFFLLMKQ